MKKAAIITLLIAAGAIAGEPLFDLDPYSIREESPGVFRTFGSALCAVTNAPNAGTLTLKARVRPERCESPQWAALGIIAYCSPDDYWQLALVKPSDAAKTAGKHTFELKAMVDSVWGGEKNVARRIRNKQSGQWEYGRDYDLALSYTPERIEGTITEAETGKVLFSAEYERAEGAPPFVATRPALRVDGWFHGAISEVSAVGGEPSAISGLAPAAPGNAGDQPNSLAPAAPAAGRADLREKPFIPSGPETGLRGTATGFFHMERIDGRDWPIDPTGRAVILAGTQHIKPQGTFSDAAGYSPYGRFVATNYPSVDAWADETLARLNDWGFTMLGNACALGVLSHKTLPHVKNLQMGQRVSRGDPDWYIREWGFKPCSALPNVFHPDFAATCEWRAREMCAPYKDDPWLIGWFIDNELAWWGTSKRIESTGVYALVSKLPKTHSARKVLDAFLAERGLTVGPDVPREAKIDFLRLYAHTYYEKTTAAIRKADPNHMILGSRYAGLDGAAPVVWEEAGKFCDVVTFNCYPWADLDRGIVLDAEGGVPMAERLREYYGYAKAPLMVTEWSFPALDHGHPCLVGAGQRFRTQKERVEATMLFAKTLLADPHVAGYDYFKWNDQPKTGSSRFAPEDCNYGLVNDFGVPYEGITQAFKELHANLVRWRTAPQESGLSRKSARPGAGAPGAKPSERERFFAEAMDKRQATGDKQPAFDLQPDGSWCLSNRLLRLSGRIGDKWMASQVAFADGKPVGRLGALLAAEDNDFYKWIDTTHLANVSFSRDDATGAGAVLLRALGGRAADLAAGAPEPALADSPPETDAETPLSFAITLRVTLLPGCPDALLELVSLENLGEAPLLASALYMRAFSFEKQERGRPASVPNLWSARKTASWTLPGGGEWGFSTIDSSVRKYRFFVTPNGVQHPDAAYSPVLEGKTFTVAPGETWQATVPMGATLFCSPKTAEQQNTPSASPYGVCAHLHRVNDPAERADECARIAATGITRVRFDFEWWRIQKASGAPFDFSHYDACVADAEAQGLTPLPILFDIPKWADPVWEHLEEWDAFIEAVVAHYGDRLPEIEIWNEENHRHFWKHEPSPENYLATLRTAYEAAKRANPRVRVLFGGTAGVPMDFIEGVYKAGGAPYFDAMNIHPYSHPRQPEGNLDVKLEAVRALMAKYGDAEKPIAITELGWPTHDARLGAVNVLRAGLRLARPEQKVWRVAYAATQPGQDGGLPREEAEAIEAALPAGSTCEACFGARLRERLAAGDLDAVIYPFDETFPEDTAEEVIAFVNAGGVLVDAGGMPMWSGVHETAPGVFVSGGKSGLSGETVRKRLGIDVSAWWIDSALTNAYVKANPSEEAKAAGYLGDPAGEDADRFQTPRLMGPGDEFIPLLVAKDAKGRDAVAASVIRRDGGRRGCVVVSGLRPRGAFGTNSEDNQARYLVRAMAICFAEGVESYYWYEFRGREIDPQYSEHHFGLTHQNFSPKPAWGAYRNFVLARPAGSVQAPGAWHDAARQFFFPQWTRPDGVKAGVIWKTGAAERIPLKFTGDEIRFRNFTGRTMKPVRSEHGTWLVPVSDSPVFFEGGALVF